MDFKTLMCNRFSALFTECGEYMSKYYKTYSDFPSKCNVCLVDTRFKNPSWALCITDGEEFSDTIERCIAESSGVVNFNILIADIPSHDCAIVSNGVIVTPNSKRLSFKGSTATIMPVALSSSIALEMDYYHIVYDYLCSIYPVLKESDSKDLCLLACYFLLNFSELFDSCNGEAVSTELIDCGMALGLSDSTLEYIKCTSGFDVVALSLYELSKWIGRGRNRVYRLPCVLGKFFACSVLLDGYTGFTRWEKFSNKIVQRITLDFISGGRYGN